MLKYSIFFIIPEQNIHKQERMAKYLLSYMWVKATCSRRTKRLCALLVKLICHSWFNLVYFCPKCIVNCQGNIKRTFVYVYLEYNILQTPAFSNSYYTLYCKTTDVFFIYKHKDVVNFALFKRHKPSGNLRCYSSLLKEVILLLLLNTISLQSNIRAFCYHLQKRWTVENIYFENLQQNLSCRKISHFVICVLAK